eukprot:7384275-Prymnesium_polylepis.5
MGATKPTVSSARGAPWRDDLDLGAHRDDELTGEEEADARSSSVRLVPREEACFHGGSDAHA